MARTWTDEDLVNAVAANTKFYEMMIYLGLKPGGGNESRIRNRIKELELDTSHFVRKTKNGWRKFDGSTLFRKDCLYTTSIRRYFLESVEYKCSNASCGISEWAGKPVTLQVDHVDGNNRNNVVENLRLLCPNCHSQTETWGCRKDRRAN